MNTPVAWLKSCAHGVTAGDRVVVMRLNSPDVTAAFTAIWKIGTVSIPVTPRWTAREAHCVLEALSLKSGCVS